MTKSEAMGKISDVMTAVSSPLQVKRGGNFNANYGYIGATKDTFIPKLIVNLPNEINPIGNTDVKKFGLPVCRVSSQSDVTIDAYNEVLNNSLLPHTINSSNYAEFSDFKILESSTSALNETWTPIFNEHLNDLIELLKGGVYI